MSAVLEAGLAKALFSERTEDGDNVNLDSCVNNIDSHDLGYGSGGSPHCVRQGVTFDPRFHPPSPSTAVLAKALAVCRVWAARLGADSAGRLAIIVNDAGARFTEATADAVLGSAMPLLEPTPETQNLHPSRDGDGVDDELLLVQVTRFACGSYVMGYTLHHLVADGHAMATIMVAVGQATRGVAVDPVPVIDRALFFAPRNPLHVEFEHRGAEFKLPVGTENACSSSVDEVVVHRVRFTRASISSLKSRAAGARPCSTVQCVVAHLWRCITVARRLDGSVVTVARVAVDGRSRLRHQPAVPQEYVGNVVLWARPTAAAKDLLEAPLGHAAELVSRVVVRMDDRYFRSFVDFASSGSVEAERLAPTADAAKMVLSPDVEVYSLLGFPFRDIDFGSGPPFFHMRGYMAEEGLVFLVPSLSGDGSVYAYINLFRRDMDAFKDCCCSLLAAADTRL
ncbi:hypothetical protein EJB05_26726, partial [Eragrostis curvula]